MSQVFLVGKGDEQLGNAFADDRLGEVKLMSFRVEKKQKKLARKITPFFYPETPTIDKGNID